MGVEKRSIVRRQAIPTTVSQPVVTPIYPSVVYRSADADELEAVYEGRLSGYTYSREGHPNAAVLTDKIGWLEGMTQSMGYGVVTGSGMGAISTALLGLLERGDHVVASDQLYGRSLKLLTDDLPRMGFETTLADATNSEAFAASIRPNTKMIFVEVLSNPTIRVADMEGIAKLAQPEDITLLVDNTFTTPRSYQPFQHGADLVVHSLTKMLAGHSDAMLGWVAARDPERNQRLVDAAVTWGFVPSPFDCWLAERGLHSFDLRFERAQSNAAGLADALAGMTGVEAVIYPGRRDHPDHNRATAILSGNFGNMVSFRLRGGRGQANAFLRAASEVPFAPTLGDIGTTLSHPASSSHRGLAPEQREAMGITEGFIRISVGCEDPEQLIDEFDQAVEASTQV